MSAVTMTNAQFFFGLSVPLIGILVNVALIVMVNGRMYAAESMDEIWPRQRALPHQWWQESDRVGKPRTDGRERD